MADFKLNYTGAQINTAIGKALNGVSSIGGVGGDILLGDNLTMVGRTLHASGGGANLYYHNLVLEDQEIGGYIFATIISKISTPLEEGDVVGIISSKFVFTRGTGWVNNVIPCLYDGGSGTTQDAGTLAVIQGSLWLLSSQFGDPVQAIFMHDTVIPL